MPSSKVWKVLANEAKVLVTALRGSFYIKCLSCLVETAHTKHEDDDGNTYHFCDKCGRHN